MNRGLLTRTANVYNLSTIRENPPRIRPEIGLLQPLPATADTLHTMIEVRSQLWVRIQPVVKRTAGASGNIVGCFRNGHGLRVLPQRDGQTGVGRVKHHAYCTLEVAEGGC